MRQEKAIFPSFFLPHKNNDTGTDFTQIAAEPNRPPLGFLVFCNTKSNASQKACVS
jgi:hypothetical protein